VHRALPCFIQFDNYRKAAFDIVSEAALGLVVVLTYCDVFGIIMIDGFEVGGGAK